MKCTHCGAEIPDGELYCSNCGAEVQIVPDYNPLDDVLAQEVKGSIDSYTGHLPVGEGDRRRTQALRTETSGRRRTEALSGGENIRRRNTAGNTRRDNTDGGRRTEQEQMQARRAAEEKRQQIKKRQQMKKKKRRRMIIIITIAVVALAGIIGFFLYKNSYSGIVNSGYSYLDEGNYTEAETKFNRAISKDNKRAEAYAGLAKVYEKEGDLDKAEKVFLTAIESQKSNADLYKAAIQFYVDSDQTKKISELLDGCPDSVLAEVKEYVSDPPKFSLDEGTYEEVQQVSLTSDGDKIYYTVNGTNPTTSDTEYTEPILLNEGSNEVRAISVNKKGIPSLVVSKTYVIDIPVADAPAVSPSTGQYDRQMEITIQVPEGYKAYYTLDNTDPTENSTLYTGPIKMPQGQTIFSAVLVNGQGKMTQITKRNYVLELEEEE